MSQCDDCYRYRRTMGGDVKCDRHELEDVKAEYALMLADALDYMAEMVTAQPLRRQELADAFYDNWVNAQPSPGEQEKEKP